MGFFSHKFASNGGDQKNYTAKQKRAVQSMTREVNRRQKELNTKGTKATNKQGNKKTR